MAELRRKYVNRAVVLADSFERRFSPLTLDTPKALLPVANIPLLHYTLEFLAAGGIQQIYVFCRAHAEAVQKHVNECQWQSAPNLEVKAIVSNSARSPGDALRRLHQQNPFESDFILVHGDVVSNLDLGDVLYQHRLRAEKNPGALLTIVYKKSGPGHASRSRDDEAVVGMDNSTGRLLFWENDAKSKSVELDPLLLTEHPEMRLRYDLLDTGINVCSPHILPLFTDNFDYQTLRRDLIKGVLGDDIYNHEIFCHVVHHEYAARIRDLPTYASVTRNIVRRWSAPLVVDNPLLLRASAYRLYRGNVYLEQNIARHLTSVVRRDSVVGRGSKLGKNSTVEGSVVGRECRLADDVRVTDSYLFNKVVLEEGARVSDSIVGTGCRLGRGAVVEEGCVLGNGVVVGAGVHLSGGKRIVCREVEEENAGVDFVDEVTIPIDLGEGGVGWHWVVREERLWNQLVALPGLEEELDDEDNEEQSLSDDLAEEAAGSGVWNAALVFDEEVREVVRDGIASNTSIDNMTLEINGRKFAHDKTFFDCAKSILGAMLMSVPETKADDSKALLRATSKLLKRWHPLLEKFLTEEDQTELIWTLQQLVEDKEKRFAPIFQYILHQLYDLDLVEEDAVWKWAAEQEQLVGEDRRFLQQCSKFLEWLKVADEDSSSEEDSE